MKPARVFVLCGVVRCPGLVLILYNRDAMGIDGTQWFFAGITAGACGGDCVSVRFWS